MFHHVTSVNELLFDEMNGGNILLVPLLGREIDRFYIVCFVHVSNIINIILIILLNSLFCSFTISC